MAPGMPEPPQGPFSSFMQNHKSNVVQKGLEQIKPGGWTLGSLSSSEEKPAGSSHSKCGVTDLTVGSPGEADVGEVPQGCFQALQPMNKGLKYRHSSGISQKPVDSYCLYSQVSNLHVQTYLWLL